MDRFEWALAANRTAYAKVFGSGRSPQPQTDKSERETAFSDREKKEASQRSPENPGPFAALARTLLRPLSALLAARQNRESSPAWREPARALSGSSREAASPEGNRVEGTQAFAPGTRPSVAFPALSDSAAQTAGLSAAELAAAVGANVLPLTEQGGDSVLPKLEIGPTYLPAASLITLSDALRMDNLRYDNSWRG